MLNPKPFEDDAAEEQRNSKEKSQGICFQNEPLNFFFRRSSKESEGVQGKTHDKGKRKNKYKN